MAVKGIFTSDAGDLGDRQRDISYNLLSYEVGGSVPLFALSAGMDEEIITNTSTEWYEEGLSISRTRITGNVGNPLGPRIEVEDASFLHEKMIMIHEGTGEMLFVKAVNGNELTVTRGFGGGAVLPIVPGSAGDYVQLITTAFEEGSERPPAITTTGYPRNNQTHIFRRTWDITETAKAVTNHMGNRKARNQKKASMNIAEDVERALFWSVRDVGYINNKPIRTMDGVLAQLRSNIFLSPAGGLTRRVLTDFIERLFSRRAAGMADERLFFCGNVAVRALNEIALRYSHYHISETTTVWGIKVMEFRTPFGDVKLLIHPLMNENPIRSSSLYALHPGVMSMSWLRKIQETNGDNQGQASDLRDAESGVFTGEGTCAYKLEATGGILTGISVDHFEI